MKTSDFHSPECSRSGVTLTEVLMSLMIMSIGISAVAVLFPISVLRSVQATQLTNAAILKQNARTLIEMKPELVFDPDGDGNYQEHIGGINELKYIVDPSGYFAIASGTSFDGTAAFAVHPWLSNTTNPNDRNDNAARGGADWFGSIDADSDGLPEPFMALPRYDGGVRYGTIGLAPINGLLPAGGTSEEARALRMLGSTLSKLGDAWDTQVEGQPEAFVFADGTTRPLTDTSPMPPTASIVGFQFSSEIDLVEVPTGHSLVPRTATSTQIIPDPNLGRIVVFSVDGSVSASFPLVATSYDPGFGFPTSSVAQSAIWTEDLNWNASLNGLEDLNSNLSLDSPVLPTAFYNTSLRRFEVGKVLLQTTRTQDYNWMLTVRRGRDGQARGVDVVVTHNKGVTTNDERIFRASFDARTNPYNSPFTIEVLKDSTVEPAMRKGGYVLDVNNARWYRIAGHEERDVTVYATSGPVTGPGYLVRLETPVTENSPTVLSDTSLPAPHNPYPRFSGGAMFLSGVVEVYPAGSLTLPNNL